jgi:uncharacterized membrane protein YjfL (UPF0719 family)
MKPTAQGWAAIALVLVFLVVFVLRALVPALLQDQTTNNVLVGMLGAVLAIGSFYFGSMHKPPTDPPQ